MWQSKRASVLFYSLSLIKLKQVIELTLNHERKRDNPFNLCSDKKLCDLATLRFEKRETDLSGFCFYRTPIIIYPE